ncbi:hypothetical protein FA95DRAFT_1561640 [Auriscalpium vulgare]|uniref:Uncharacterized protein n=1 Tax=Auriscalpium vulgare TaxID=40419 RepID=A0ACB8RL60_9AGAM|nr:hypothetical protein FA95DRAFT_1561640 [Auriscalpium vulgare]
MSSRASAPVSAVFHQSYLAASLMADVTLACTTFRVVIGFLPGHWPPTERAAHGLDTVNYSMQAQMSSRPGIERFCGLDSRQKGRELSTSTS